MIVGSQDAQALFLRRLLCRSALQPEEQQAILQLRGTVDQVVANEDITVPGDVRHHACLVVKGLAARFDQMRDGRRQIVALYVPGDMCDLHSVAVPTTGWGLQAMTATSLLLISHDELRWAISNQPGLMMAFWRDTVADASILAKGVANVGRRRAVSRLAHLLCELGVRMELAGLGTRTAYPLPATQVQLADALGLTAVHLNRTLMVLRKNGVELANGRVRLERWEEIVSLAEFDPAYLLLPEPLSSRFG